jgi:hypothetical protein
VIEDWLRQAVYYRIRDRLVAGSWKTNDLSVSDDIDAFKACLKEMKSECDSRSIDLVFLLLGSKDQRGDLTERQAEFLEFAAANETPLINMIEIMKSGDHDELFLDHCHPSSEGHQIIGDSLFGVLID